MAQSTDTTAVTATLVRGRYHDFKGIVWDRDKGQITHVVDAETEAYLRENAVEITVVEDQEFLKPKFSFSNDAPKLPSRRRQLSA